MSAYPPPTQNLSLFNPLYFETDLQDLSVGYLDANYLKYPVAQGLENLQQVNITDTTQSTNTTSGSLVTAGGIGVAKQMHVGQQLHAISGATSTSTTTGALRVTGGVGVSENLNVGGLTKLNGGQQNNFINITGATTSTSAWYGSHILINSSVVTDLNLSIPSAGSVGMITIYCDSSTTQTILSVSGVFYGCGWNGVSSIKMRKNDLITFRSDSFNWFIYTSTNIIPARRTYIGRRVVTAQNLNNATHTIILFDGTITGTGSQTGIDYNAGTFTNNRGCSVLVTISYTLIFNANATGYRVSYVRATQSAVTREYAQVYSNAISVDTSCNTGSVTLLLANTDTFVIRGWQNSGGVLGLVTDATTCTIFINDTC